LAVRQLRRRRGNLSEEKNIKEEVVIYTDGSCSGNPGPGGWAAILSFGDRERVITGAAKQTTNNRMELTAAIEALRVLKFSCKVLLHTDSAYVERAFNDKWIENWIKKGWKTASRKPVENQDLWKQLLGLTNIHEVQWIKVKGHADNDLNNRVDGLAVEAMRIQ
jgi:ribonuclease HI